MSTTPARYTPTRTPASVTDVWPVLSSTPLESVEAYLDANQHLATMDQEVRLDLNDWKLVEPQYSPHSLMYLQQPGATLLGQLVHSDDNYALVRALIQRGANINAVLPDLEVR